MWVFSTVHIYVCVCVCCVHGALSHIHTLSPFFSLLAFPCFWIVFFIATTLLGSISTTRPIPSLFILISCGMSSPKQGRLLNAFSYLMKRKKRASPIHTFIHRERAVGKMMLFLSLYLSFPLTRQSLGFHIARICCCFLFSPFLSHIYIYIYMCVCVCVCKPRECEREDLHLWVCLTNLIIGLHFLFTLFLTTYFFLSSLPLSPSFSLSLSLSLSVQVNIIPTLKSAFPKSGE